MNPDIKAQWVAALRSGEYKQGRDRLRRGDEFCCLGVLCHLAGVAGAVEPAKVVAEYPKARYYYVDNGYAEPSVLPGAVMSWAGLDDPNPSVAGLELSAYNDGTDFVKPHSFGLIADLIEEHL